MKVLVIPDVHLKPWMFHRASELMKEIKADRAVAFPSLDQWLSGRCSGTDMKNFLESQSGPGLSYRQLHSEKGSIHFEVNLEPQEIRLILIEMIYD